MTLLFCRTGRGAERRSTLRSGCERDEPCREAHCDSRNPNLEPRGDYQRLQAGENVIASGQAGYQPGDVVSPHAAFIPTAAQEVSE